MRRAPPPPALPPTALPPPTALSRRNRGFALLIVLWTLVLVDFLVLHMTASGRTEIRIADNLVANAVAAAAADGAIAEAIFNLSDPRPEQRWPLDGPPRILAVGECPVVVRLEDEASRINPNLAAPELMAALLQVLGSDPNAAQHIAAATGPTGSALRRRPRRPTRCRRNIVLPASITDRPGRRSKPWTNSAACSG